MTPIYKPKGAAKEYGDYAINIYTGCPHRCYYCFAPNVLHRDREAFHSHVEPREGIVEAVEKQLATGKIKDQLIHLCFTCDPYPTGYDSTATREIIKLIKASGNHVQILTKGDGSRDFDLLDENDWYGISFSGYDFWFKPPIEEPKTFSPYDRLNSLKKAHDLGIRTWASHEPVLKPDDIYSLIATANYIDKFKIGKLNYHPSNINWAEFGKKAEAICIEYGRDYMIKDSLRAEMEK